MQSRISSTSEGQWHSLGIRIRGQEMDKQVVKALPRVQD